jgi:RNA polymerase sigma-70 factor (ECF subfamily)
MTEDQYSVELRPEVLHAVMGLPPQQRAAVYLTYWRDLPISETSELLGCRPGTVKRYLFLARNRLKELLSDA